MVPGLRVKDLLTPHFLRERMRWSVNEQRLSGAVAGMGRTGSVPWRSMFQDMGYQAFVAKVTFVVKISCLSQNSESWLTFCDNTPKK